MQESLFDDEQQASLTCVPVLSETWQVAGCYGWLRRFGGRRVVEPVWFNVCERGPSVLVGATYREVQR